MMPALPRYLQVAHWLHEQQRAISARETAEVFGVSYWSVDRDFAKIRRLCGIVVFDEHRVPSKGGQQYLLRVLQIFPYWLDEARQPHRQVTESWALGAPLTWRDLLCCPWYQLVERHQRLGKAKKRT